MKDKGLWRAVAGDRELPPGGGEESAEGDRLVIATKTMAVTVLRKFCKRYGLKRTQADRTWRQVEERSWSLKPGSKPSHDHSSLVP